MGIGGEKVEAYEVKVFRWCKSRIFESEMSFASVRADDWTRERERESESLVLLLRRRLSFPPTEKDPQNSLYLLSGWAENWKEKRKGRDILIIISTQIQRQFPFATPFIPFLLSFFLLLSRNFLQNFFFLFKKFRKNILRISENKNICKKIFPVEKK